MQRSTRIALTYMATALVVALASSVLLYLAWRWQPPADTLAQQLRLVALCLLPLLCAAQILQIAFDPLVWRVVRRLRWHERQAV